MTSDNNKTNDNSTTNTTNINNNNNNASKDDDKDDDNYYVHELSGAFRGVAAATRKLIMMPAHKIIRAAATTKPVAAKSAIRAIGNNRPLAFASEGAVAGQSMIPKLIYYGAWGLSGTAIMADIYNKYDDAAHDKKWQTVVYWTTFHIPASLVVPAVIIHQIVHTVEKVVDNPKSTLTKSWSPRMKSMAPVAAALISIIPVVPIVDTTAEYIMEPTLGSYLGLQFHHHHHAAKSINEDNKKNE